MDRSREIGVGSALVCLVLLGGMPLLAAARPVGFDALSFAILVTAWQLAAALPLTAVEFAKGDRLALLSFIRAERGSILIVVATGAMFGLATYLYVLVAETAGPVSLAIALQAYPVFATIGEALFFGVRKTRLELLFLAALILALAYLVTDGTYRIDDLSWWSACALIVPLLWSVAHVALRQVIVKTSISPNQVTVSRLLVSGVFLLAVCFALGKSASLQSALFDFDLQRSASLFGVVYYLELLFWFHAMRRIDVSLASSVTVPAPALTMLGAMLFLGDEVKGYQLLTMAVIFISLYGLLWSGRKR